MGQCRLIWPSSVSGGLTDDRCPNEATTTVDGVPVCGECAESLLD